jgi:hypothetical protein
MRKISIDDLWKSCSTVKKKGNRTIPNLIVMGHAGRGYKAPSNELQALGYAISVQERQEALCGATTLGATQVFQQRHALERSGVVDEHIAMMLQWEPGPEVAPISFGSVFTLSAF